MSTEDHICTQQAKIGAIEATLQHQSDADSRIESNLTDLVKAVQANQSATQNEFKSIATNFAKIETILVDQKTTIDDTNKDQKEIKSGLDKLSDRVATIEKDVENNTGDITTLKAASANADERITKIEKWIIRVIAIITALGLLIEFISNVDAVKRFFFPELQTQTIEKVNK